MAKKDKFIPVSKQLSRRILAITVITTSIVAILVLAFSTYGIQKTSNTYFTNSLYGANESIEKRLGKVTADSLFRHLRRLDSKLNALLPFSLKDMNGLDDKDIIAYNIIIDSAGNYIYHHNRECIGKSNFFDDIRQSSEEDRQQLGKELASNNTGRQGITIKGNSSYIFYMPLEGTSWKNAIVVPRHTVMMPVLITRLILLAIIAIGLLVIYRKSYRTIRHATAPLRLLTRSVNEVAKGNFKTPLPEIWRNNEIRQLRDSFANMQQSIIQYIEQLQETTAKQAYIERDLETAKAIQMSMIPTVFPKRDDADIYGSIKPAMLVGGDFYDFFIKNNKVFFCIGDVSGKGIPAALFMTVYINLFRAFASEENKPEIIVSRMNKNLCRNNPEYMFVTCFVGILDLTSGLLQYCNAGHTYPYLINNKVEVLPINHHPAVGAFDDIEYKMQEVVIAPQTTILLYTDGLNEATNADDKQYGEDRILDELNHAVQDGQTSSKDVIDRMNQAVQTFVGDANQSDDLTMLCVRLK